MKFAEHLQAHLTPEWRTQYIDYDELKEFCYKCCEEAPSENEEVARLEYFVQKDDEFYELCERELNKINEFFDEKVAEAKRKLKDLEWELREFKIQAAEKKFVQSRMTLEISEPSAKQTETFSRAIMPGSVLRRREEQKRKRKRVRKLHGIKLAYQEFYLNLILLQNYQTLNFTGFRKILKKHDKIFGLSSGYQWRVRNVESARFNLSKEVTEFITRVEQTYITDLEHGDRQAAMKRLRVPPLTEHEKPWSIFFVGFFFGIFLVQAVTVLAALVFVGNGVWPWEPALRMFRSTFLVAVFLFLLALNTYGWRSAGVNHVLIFEIDPRDHLTHTEIMQISGVFAVAWALALQLFLCSSWLAGLPTYAAPLAVCLFMPLYLLNPLPVCQHKSRRWLCRILFRIFTAPFHAVTFADFWLADQLNSLAILFLDAEFFVCFYATQVDWAQFTGAAAAAPVANRTATAAGAAAAVAGGGACSGLLWGLTPVVKCLPAWFRFAQCVRRYYDMKERHAFPHLVNAGKYSMTFFVTASAVVYSTSNSTVALLLYILLSVCATAYCYGWDILMDWGLLERPRANRLLRNELVYRRRWLYYAAMLEDLLLRLTWSLAIGLKFMPGVNQQVLLSLLSLLEVVRRFVWNFFRLENEHLNNCGQFRAVRDIYIEPIRPKDQQQQQQQQQQPIQADDDETLSLLQLQQHQHQQQQQQQVPNTPRRYAPHLYRSHDRLHQHLHHHQQQQQQQQQLQQLQAGSSRSLHAGAAAAGRRQRHHSESQRLTNTQQLLHLSLSSADAFPLT